MGTMQQEATVIDRGMVGAIRPRLDKADAAGLKHENCPAVRVVTFCEGFTDSMNELRGKVTLVDRDPSDPFRTFRVTNWEGVTEWVYDIAPWEESEYVDEGPVTLDGVEEPLDDIAGMKKPALREKVAELRASLAMARLEIDNKTQDITGLREQHRVLAYTHEAFRDQVREKAIEVASDRGWCDDGLNEVLEELGLDPKEDTEKEVEFDLLLRVHMTATSSHENALSEDFIADSFSNLSVSISMDSDWENEADTSVEVENIENVQEA